jgi:stage V sporulation protein G
MEITEVRVKLLDSPKERLKAFCSITLDSDFVIRDLKIIDGANGEFVAMPSRKLSSRCSKCGSKNHLRARFCNECGSEVSSGGRRDGRTKLHADVAHPINAECRERIQASVIKAYHEEKEQAKSPDYKPARYDEYEYEDDGEQYEDLVKDLKKDAEARREEPAKPEPRRPVKAKPSGLDDKFGLPLDFDDDDEEILDEEEALVTEEVKAEPVASERRNDTRSEPRRSEPARSRPAPEQPRREAEQPRPEPARAPAPPPPPAPVKPETKVEASDDDNGFGAGLF